MAAAALVGTVSCSDFLDEDNKTGQTADLTYQTESGLEGLVKSCYAYTRGWWGKEAGLGLSECGTDLFLYGGDNKQRSLTSYTFTSAGSDGSNVSDDHCLDHYWEMFYAAVDVCNNAIKYIGENTLITDAVRNQYYGEAYFLRALYYSQMVATWGPIPYNAEPISTVSTAPVRVPESQVYANILKDLDQSMEYFKAANIMDKKKGGETGKATYYAAEALKARVALYAASWLGATSVEGYGNLYQVAQQCADDVINNSGAKFYDRFSDTWNSENEDILNNDEAIWAVHYTDELNNGQYSNLIPYRFKTNASGDHQSFSSLITRTGYNRGGSAMLLMFQGLWNNSSVDDVGGNGTGVSNIFVRVLGTTTASIKSAITGDQVDVTKQYSPYGRGFQRYLPSLYLWRTLESVRATDQRAEGTLLSHYNIADGLQQNRKAMYPLMGQFMTSLDAAYAKDGNYFNAGDTAIYFSPLNGDSPEGKAAQAWAKDRYRIQFAAGGDIPIFSSDNYATAQPTTKGKATSDVYGDNRYAKDNVGGYHIYPGIKKFLDTKYDPAYPTYDISGRDAVVLRLAEMYLIKSEAQLGQNNNSGALATINQLREVRAIDGKEEANKLASVDINTILEERAIELCGEQQRWFDLKRTHKLIEYVKGRNAQAQAVEAKHYYRPIPLSQMDACTNVIGAPASADANGVLQYTTTADGMWQNPGY